MKWDEIDLIGAVMAKRRVRRRNRVIEEIREHANWVFFAREARRAEQDRAARRKERLRRLIEDRATLASKPSET